MPAKRLKVKKKREKNSKQFKDIWEDDKDAPQEEKKRRIAQVFEILLGKNSY